MADELRVWHVEIGPRDSDQVVPMRVEAATDETAFACALTLYRELTGDVGPVAAGMRAIELTDDDDDDGFGDVGADFDIPEGMRRD